MATKRNTLCLADLVSKFSNIKVVFLPKNTTSHLQPLDAGIIKNFKSHYRKLIVKHTLSKISGSTLTATQIAKSIDILTAIRWVKQAWDAVIPDTVANCFKHCGVQPRPDETTDPFADLDERHLMSRREMKNHQMKNCKN